MLAVYDGQDFAEAQIKYLDLDLPNMTAEFARDIHVPIKPFQGTLGVAAPDGYFPPLSSGVTNSVPPGPHAGNTDLRLELSPQFVFAGWPPIFSHSDTVRFLLYPRVVRSVCGCCGPVLSYRARRTGDFPETRTLDVRRSKRTSCELDKLASDRWRT